MHDSFFTLNALAREWNRSLTGSVIFDVYSQFKDELTIAVTRNEKESMLRLGTRPGRFSIFRVPGYNRARRNVTTLFTGILGSTIASIDVATRDRIVLFRLSTGCTVHVHLHGPKPNVFLVGDDGLVKDVFQDFVKWVGKLASAGRPATHPESQADFVDGWRSDAESIPKALSRSYPLLGKVVCAEIVYRAGLADRSESSLDKPELAVLYRIVEEVLRELGTPRPEILREPDGSIHFCLFPLLHKKSEVREKFTTVDEAIRVFRKEQHAAGRFNELFLPLERSLVRTQKQCERRTEAMLRSLSAPGKADYHEKCAHLLMAYSDETTGLSELELPDLFTGEGTVKMKLNPALTRTENANILYEKAKNARTSRINAEARWEQTESDLQFVSDLLTELKECQTASAVADFKKKHATVLARLIGGSSPDVFSLPFRRFKLDDGWEVWVGRNARENDQLTFQHAHKVDTWLHARDVPGSHVVLRHDNKSLVPPGPIVEKAAGIAAHFSRSRTSSLAPVQITQKKYVRKIRKGSPGQVRVDQERVLLVKPGLPE